MRRTSGSSIVRQVVACWANGGVPLTIASAMAFSVRTWRPGRSDVRSTISSCARLLKATRLTALGGRFHFVSRWRARSVSTRVLPEPAGAMMRAPPPRWVTAASWSGARSASERFAPGGRSDPCSTATACTTGTSSMGSVWRAGPPSSHTAAPSDNRTSPGPSAGSAPAATAESRRIHVGRSGSRWSTLFAQTRWCSSSRSNAKVGPSSYGAASVINIGSRSNGAASSMTSRSRA